jgi:hypothetical protein
MKRILTFVIALVFVGASWGGTSVLANDKKPGKKKKKEVKEVVLIVKNPNATCKAAIEAHKPNYAQITPAKSAQDIKIVLPPNGADNKKYQTELKKAGCSWWSHLDH